MLAISFSDVLVGYSILSLCIKFKPGELAFQVTACDWISLFFTRDSKHSFVSENSEFRLRRLLGTSTIWIEKGVEMGEMDVKTERRGALRNVKFLLTTAHVILFCFLNRYDPVDSNPTPSSPPFCRVDKKTQRATHWSGTKWHSENELRSDQLTPRTHQTAFYNFS